MTTTPPEPGGARRAGETADADGRGAASDADGYGAASDADGYGAAGDADGCGATGRPGELQALRRTVLVLGGGRWVANASLRWIPLFLPALARGLDASLSATTTVMGIGELLGFIGLAAGPVIGRWGTRRVLVGGLVAVVLGNAVAGTGTGLALFGIGYAALIGGEACCSLGGQTWIGEQVPTRWRSRFVGAYESSWALSLLLGAPLAALAVRVWWGGPFWLWSAGGVLGALLVVRAGPRHAPAARATAGLTGAPPTDDAPTGDAPAATTADARARRPSRQGWFVVALTGALMVGNIAVVVSSGAWLERSHGFDAGALGAVAFLLGGAELVASLAVGRLTERFGARRCLFGATGLCGVALALIGADPATAVLAVAALTAFVAGFEFALITGFSVALHRPAAELARLMGTAGAAITAARAAGAAVTGPLFERAGIGGVALLAAAGYAVVAALIRPATTET